MDDGWEVLSMAAIWVLVRALTWAVVMALKSLEARFLIWSVDNLEIAVGLNELMIDMVAPVLDKWSSHGASVVVTARVLLVQVQDRRRSRFL